MKRLVLESLEARDVPATVYYEDLSRLAVSNTFLLDQPLVLDSPGYNPNISPFTIQITTAPTKGTVQVINGYDFNYGPNLYASGTDLIGWKPMQNGVALTDEQFIVIDVGGGTLGNETIPVSTLPEPSINFQPFVLSTSNSVKSLFLEASNPPGMIQTTIDLTTVVSGTASNGSHPTGKVRFTYRDNGGAPLLLGVATIQQDGKATIQADSGLLAKAGVTVEAEYLGNPFFAPKKLGDGDRTSEDLLKDIVVNNNPAVPANAQNLTVVFVGGNDAAEQLRWVKSGREHYGANAILVTGAHNIADVGVKMATFPAGSISKLVFGAHGSKDGFMLDSSQTSWFTATAVNDDAVTKLRIKTALKASADIEIQACRNADGQVGQANLKLIANMFNAKVKASKHAIASWDDTTQGIVWVTVQPD